MKCGKSFFKGGINCDKIIWFVVLFMGFGEVMKVVKNSYFLFLLVGVVVFL